LHQIPKSTNILIVKLRLPICEIFQLFRSLVYFILPFTDVQNFSDRIFRINKCTKFFE